MANNNVAIAVDSTASIPEELIKEHNIHVMPLRVIWPGDPIVHYKHIVEPSPAEFYENLKNSDEIPTTSQPSPAEFVEFFGEIGKESREIVAILVSGAISGTLKSAQFALNMVEHINIELVDSKTAGMAMGTIALMAAEQAEAGNEIEEIAQFARISAEISHSWVVVETLKYLHKGGRVSGSKKMIGNMLNLKPILQTVDGRLELFGTVRTMKKAINAMLDHIEFELKTKKNPLMAISHADNALLAQETADKIRERFLPEILYIVEMSPVLGTHAGPGAIGVSHLALD